MIRIVGTLVLALMVGELAIAAPMTPGEAAAAGKSDGQARNPTTKDGINATTGATHVPGYATTSPEAAYFGGGNGNVASPTTAKLAECAALTTAECVAINLMRHKSSAANPITINPLDPMVTNARAVTNAPAGALGITNNIFVEPAAGVCPPGSSASGGGSFTENCEQHVEQGEKTCQRPWELEIKPWWRYTCEKSDVTVTYASCERTLGVTVDWVPNCEVGENVVEQEFGWTKKYKYHTFHSRDFMGFENGGVVRAKCIPTETEYVRLTMWGGYVAKNTYGSGDDTPDPDASLLPTGDSLLVPISVTTPIFAPTSEITILPGSGCVDGACTYTLQRGPKLYGCTGGFISWTVSDYNSSVDYVQTSYDEGLFGDIESAGTVCLATPYDPIYNFEGDPICTNGDYRWGNKCYPRSGVTPTVIGGGSNGRQFTVSFRQPAFVPMATDTWSSTCGALEASASCAAVGDSCVDGPSTRNINGADITRACWKRKIDYECKTPSGPNSCLPLTEEPECAQIGVGECLSTTADGTCKTFRAEYKCGKDMGPPSDVTETGHGYDTVKDSLDETQCEPLASNVDCIKRDSTCTDSGSKTFFGFVFNKACWNYEDTYTCPIESTTNDCQPLVDRGCQLIAGSEECISRFDSGACNTTTYTYECGTQATAGPTGAVCESSPYCINGVCYERERPSDPDFGTSVAAMEVSRQMANYIDEGSMQVFVGSPNTCKKKLLVNCCKGNGSGGSISLTNSAFYTAVSFGRRYAGSMYVFDTLFASDLPTYLINGLEALGITSAVNASTFSAYGVTIGWGSSGFNIVAFDPWMFAAQVVINIVLGELMSCPENDQTTAVKKDQGVCERIGSYCSSKVLGSCVETKEVYCCFNSKLSKAINIQGKAQLGISTGVAKAPDCRGLTVEEIGQLDMSRIDFSEFLADIVGNSISMADAESINADSIGNRNPCVDANGHVNQSEAGRMDCQTSPVSGGESTDGPGSSPIPGPAPTVPAVPQVTLEFLPQVAEFNESIIAATTTTDVTSLTYECTGAQPMAGSLPLGVQNTIFVAEPQFEGKTVCLLTAANDSSSVTVEGWYVVTKHKPKVSVTASSNTVNAAAPFTLTVTASNTTSGAYECSGGLSNSGTFGNGTTALTFTAPVNAGTVVCNFRAEGNGFFSSATVQVNILAVEPTLVVATSPSAPKVGQTLVLNTTTTNATSLNYRCAGSLVSAGLMSESGTIAVGTSSISIATDWRAEGTTTCIFDATSQSGNVASRTLEIVVDSAAASVSAQFNPSSVAVGAGYQLITSTVGMSSLRATCIGPKQVPAEMALGANTISYIASGGEVGSTVCQFTGKDAVTGVDTIVEARLSVVSGTPSVMAQWQADTVRVGTTAVLNSNITGAVSGSYACGEPMNRSGALPTGVSNTSFVTDSTNVGVVTCFITANGADGSSSVQEVRLNVIAMEPTLSVTVSPASVNVGETYSLDIETVNARTLSYSCTGPGGPESGVLEVGAYSLSYIAVSDDVGTKNCTFIARNENGESVSVSRSHTVTLYPPTIAATISAASARVGDTVTLTGVADYATSMSYACTGGVVGSGPLDIPSGSVSAVMGESNLGASTCTIEVTGPGGSASSSVSFTVLPALPTVVASISPTTIRRGLTATLSGTSTNATSLTYACTGSVVGSGTLTVPNGSVSALMGPGNVGTATCRIDATGPGGSASSSVDFIVGP